MFKLGYLVGDTWVEHSHPPIYAMRDTPGGDEKVVATAPGGAPIVFQRLADCLTPPFFLLYLLHTPRGEGEPGRYQSSEIDGEELHNFLCRFDRLLRSDARFDLWLHSAFDGATIVWDRHNLVHGYGAAPSFVEALRAIGFHEGDPVIPTPHEHHYHQSLDDDACAVLASMRWTYSPLRPEDEQ